MSPQSARARASSTARGLDELILSGGGQGVSRGCPVLLPPPRDPRRAPWLTLGAHQRQGHVAGAAEVAEQRVQPRHLLEAALALQAEDEDDGVRPAGKLGGHGLGSGLGSGQRGPPGPQGPWYLRVRGAGLLPDEQEVALAINCHLTLELATCSGGGEGREGGDPAGMLRPHGWNVPWP